MKPPLIFFVVLAFMHVSCDVPQQGGMPPPRSSAEVASEMRPVRVVVFVDQTCSMRKARSASISASSLTLLVDRLATSGGEVALGLIRDRSDAPLARLFIPAPPTLPARPLRAKENIFIAAAAERRSVAERAVQSRAIAGWRADARDRVAVFRADIAPYLERRYDARSTDIHAALLRAEVFAGEPTLFPERPRTVVILVTDGLETVNASCPLRFRASAEILLVNGTGSVGGLAPLHPVRFESLAAAIRYALREGGPHA